MASNRFGCLHRFLTTIPASASPTRSLTGRDPTLDLGRDQDLFYFHFDEYALRRWSSDHASHISWWIASKLLKVDESVTPGITRGMLVYLNLVTEDLHALPTPMHPVCEGITVGIWLSPDLSSLRNEVIANLRLQMIAKEIPRSAAGGWDITSIDALKPIVEFELMT